MFFSLWARRARSGRAERRPRQQPWTPRVKSLEARDLPSGFQPTNILAQPHGGVTSFATAGPTGTTPAQIRHAYGFDQIKFNNGTVVGDGSGTTIAIVDAYDDPKIATDLHAFDQAFGLPDPTFTKVNQNGGSTPPAANGGWATEIALDVEWAHAIAPGAKILLVEANDSSDTNLFAAVRYAASQPGVVAVSMSWGGGEYSAQTSLDSSFQTPAGHGGVTFIVSSGDSGAPTSYPATSPNVLSVGGTTLKVDSAGNILSESGWSGSGGGISAIETQPSYQKGMVTQTTTMRANPDVSYDADPNTGFPVYDSYNNSASTPWGQWGGTSDAAPQWAGLIAIADQGRALAGKASLDGPSQTLPMLYGLPSADFHDVITGSSTGSPSYSAGAGYDLVTGRGSPVANLVVGGLVGQPSTPAATHFSVSSTVSSSTAGSSLSVTVTALDASNNLFAGYLGTVHFSSSDATAALPGNYTFTTADGGKHTFSVTLDKAGSQTITATDTISSSLSGSGTVTVSAAAADHLAFGQQPTSAGVGSVISPAVTVQVLDRFNNVLTGDNTDTVTLTLGNAGGSTLGGTTSTKVIGGVATFSNLSIGSAGTGYTLLAGSGSMANVTSASFNVSSTAVIEGFETSDLWNVTGGGTLTAVRATYARHDGAYGLDSYAGQNWMYRDDAGAQVKQGDTISVWLQLAGGTDGRAYFGFGASAGGTLALVVAPNTNQLILQQDIGGGFSDLAAVSQTYKANHWYRLEVDWGASGAIVGKLFDSNGTTLLKSVSASTTAITSGGIGFRAIGNYHKYWDTVTAQYGVNKSLVLPHTASPGNGLSGLITFGQAVPGGGFSTWVAPAVPNFTGPPLAGFVPGASARDRLFAAAVSDLSSAAAAVHAGSLLEWDALFEQVLKGDKWLGAWF